MEEQTQKEKGRRRREKREKNHKDKSGGKAIGDEDLSNQAHNNFSANFSSPHEENANSFSTEMPDGLIENEGASLEGNVAPQSLARTKSDLSDDLSFEELVSTDDESYVKLGRRRSSLGDSVFSDSPQHPDTMDSSEAEPPLAAPQDERPDVSSNVQNSKTLGKSEESSAGGAKKGVENEQGKDHDNVSIVSQGSTYSYTQRDKMRQPVGVTPLFFANTKSLASGATYLDQSLLNNIPQSMAHDFSVEHRFFIRAVIDLLNERDIVGVEANIDDPNTLKSGKLKKASAFKAGFKTKYVELRMGTFTYYDEDPSKHTSSAKRRHIGKHILLRRSVTTCRAVSSSHKLPGSSSGYIFELRTRNSGEPSTKRYFLASSQEERQEWIREIHESTIGGVMLSPLHRQISKNDISNQQKDKGDLDLFLNLQKKIRESKCREDFSSVFDAIAQRPLTVPVVWIRERVEALNWLEQKGDFDSDCSDFSSQFWRDLHDEVVSINGFILEGCSGQGAERIIGALTRCILDFDRLYGRDLRNKQRVDSAAAPLFHDLMSEVQAICYARDILQSSCRGRGHGEANHCVEKLCGNSDLKVIECEPPDYIEESIDDEALVIHVSCPHFEEGSGDGNRKNEQSGWITSRSSSRDPWRSRFCVLADGNFTYFEREHPSPHGLLEQLDLLGATIGISEVKSKSRRAKTATDGDEKEKEQPDENSRFLVVLVTKDRAKERQLCFDNRTEFLAWQEALQSALKEKDNLMAYPKASDHVTPFTHSTALVARKRGGLLRGLARHSNSPHVEELANKLSTLEQKLSQSKISSKEARNPDLGVEKIKSQGHSVEVVVVSWTYFQVSMMQECSKSDTEEITILRAKIEHTFHLSGGPTGKALCTSEVVCIDAVSDQNPDETVDDPTS